MTKTEGVGFPAWRSTFVGRQVERTSLHARLDHERLVTVVGAGGSGKTRLAVEVARERSDSTDHGPWFVELAPISDGGKVPMAILAAVGANEQAWRDPLDAVGDWIGGAASLVVVDNCEHVLPGARRSIGRLLDSCPNLTVLVTSREPLGIDGEAVWSLPALGSPPMGADAEAIVAFDAVQLFVDRARLVHHEFDLTTMGAGSVAELVRRLDGLPLAIELAAARASMMSLDQILQGLDDRFRLLSGSGRIDAMGHPSLLVSVDWSYDLLGVEEQALLRRLAVFAGTFSLDAVEAVACGEPVERREVLDLLAGLVARSLVVVDRTDERAARYRLLETFRAYGWRRLGEHGEDQDLRFRHLEWAADLVTTAERELVRRGQQEWLDRMEREHDNVREALAFAEDVGRIDTALTMAAGMNLFWKLRGHFGEAKATLLPLLERAPLDGEARRAAEWALADICTWMGDNDGAMTRGQAVLDAARAAGDDLFAARALWTFANVRSQFDLDEAFVYAMQAHDLATAAGDFWLQGVSLEMAALALRFRGEHERARPLLDTALALADEHDIPQLVAWVWVGRQPAANDLGNFVEADRCYERGMAAATSINDPATTGQLAEAHADGLLLRGRQVEAQRLLAAASADLEASGARSYAPFLHHRMVVALAGVDDEAAAAEIDRILELPVPSMAAIAYADLARTWVAVASRDPSAAETARVAVGWSRGIGHPRLVAEHLVLLGHTRLAADQAEAADAFHEALTTAIDAGFLPWVADALDGIAACETVRGDHPMAVRIQAAAARLRTDLGAVRHRVLHQRLVPIETTCRAELGPGADLAAAQGTAMTTAEAVQHARRNRGRRNRPTTGWASLTPAEEQVVALVAEGLTNREIAARLFVSTDTVKTHVRHAVTKVGVANRAELAVMAARRSG